MREDTQLNANGRARSLHSLHDDLRRLKTIVDDRARYPQIAQVQIKQPLFILGLPRCGTSLLHALIGGDPQVRTPLMWEIAEPSPPPEMATFDRDPRIGMFDAYMRAHLGRDYAEVIKGHPLGPKIPQECGSFMTDAGEIAQRLERLAGYVDRYVHFALAYGHRQRAQGHINRLEHDDWAGRGGVKGQHYYQGIFDSTPGETMIVETELPQRVRYWNIQLNDPLWNTIDWLSHQSSLNGAQAVIDADGKFRAVISVDDPGVPNWLDPGGHLRGSLMLRWTEASSGPEPQVRIVPAIEVRRHLPPATGTVTAEARAECLRKRRRGAQLRHRW